jgi:hypothetical protein
MRELSKKLHKKIKELEEGKLDIKELESLTDDARELYERMLILKYKAYEKFGEPANATEEVVEEKVEPVKAVVEEEEEVVEEAIDFSGITEEKEEVEQPSFDFSAMEEEVVEPKEEPVMIPSENIKSSSEPITEEETFPKSSGTKDQPTDVFQDSHVEKVEDEDENSLNEKLKTEDEQSLRKQFQSTPVSDLKKEISIAKKFEYITFMFEGENDLYEAAIEDLNNCTDGEEAKNKLNDYSTKHSWDLENKSIIKFVELVERRYL